MNAEINLTSTATKFSFEACSADGRRWQIQARSWGALESAGACALLVHGLGAHSGWFEAFASRLAERGVFVMSYDQVGFGARRHERFHSNKEWLDDLIASFAYLSDLSGNRPVFLIGNSMGAVVTYCCIDKLNPQAVILFSPGFDGHPVTFSPAYKLNALIASVFTPDKDIELPYSVDDITPSQSVRKFLASDPERRFTINARMGMELLKLTMSTKLGSKTASCPVMMATAGVEKIVDNNASESAFAKLKAPEKHRMRYNDSWHDLMFDENIDNIVDDAWKWLSQTAPLNGSK